jgi:ABC-type nitrate/sulfonate/bicarbonate transport system ATPase subunit/ABC-type nitrate/sulfonate/bicarbonate transport system permease component
MKPPRSWRWIIGFSVLLILWTLGATFVRSTRADLPPKVLEQLYPSPLQILKAATEVHVKDLVWQASTSSFRVLAGFLAAAIVALPLGFGMGRSRALAAAFEPANDFLRYLPVAGFGSLTIFLLGVGNASAIAVVFLGTVFHLVVASANASSRISPAYVDLATTLGLDWRRRLRTILIPAAAPELQDAIRISVGWAWSYVTLAEIMGTEGGLGQAIEVARRYVRTDLALFWIGVVGVLGVVSDQLMRWWQRKRIHWSTCLPKRSAFETTPARDNYRNCDPGSIELKRIEKEFRRDKASSLVVFSDLNLHIRPRSFTVILGPSGCGKSTLLRMIAGVEKPDQGDVNVCSTGIGLMQQNYPALPWFTVWQNLELALGNGRVCIAPDEQKQVIVKALTRVGLYGWQDAYPEQLSGGMRQRLALARILVMKPSVILLDEPLGAIDAFRRRELQKLLRNVCETEGATFVMVTHDVSEALTIADRVVVLGDTGQGILEDRLVRVSGATAAAEEEERIISLLRSTRLTFAAGTWSEYRPLKESRIAGNAGERYEIWQGLATLERFESIRSGLAAGAFLSLPALVRNEEKLADLDLLVVHAFSQPKSAAVCEHIVLRKGRPMAPVDRRWAAPEGGLAHQVIARIAPGARIDLNPPDDAACVRALMEGAADACVIDRKLVRTLLTDAQLAELEFVPLPDGVWEEIWTVLVISRELWQDHTELVEQTITQLADNVRLAGSKSNPDVRYPSREESIQLLQPSGQVAKAFKHWGGGELPVITTQAVND